MVLSHLGNFLQENIDAMTGLVLASSLETESQQIFEKNWDLTRGTKIFILTMILFLSL
jgi:hypothetical protein